MILDSVGYNWRAQKVLLHAEIYARTIFVEGQSVVYIFFVNFQELRNRCKEPHYSVPFKPCQSKPFPNVFVNFQSDRQRFFCIIKIQWFMP